MALIELINAEHNIHYIDEDLKYHTIFDLKKINKDFGYIPFYDDLIKYCKSNNKTIANFGITHFDYMADITEKEVENFLKEKYKKYIIGEHIENATEI